jgi:iron-sulfur cluster repair protein YtfE (RIC family)
MQILEALLGEHGTFYAQLEHLEQVVPRATILAQVQSPVAMFTAALATHARMEDELLFTTLEPYLGVQMGPLAVMRMEHDQIDNILARVAEARDLAQARSLVLQVMQVARDHFAKEEQVLFPMAKRALDGNTLTQLGGKWAERRNVAIMI